MKQEQEKGPRSCGRTGFLLASCSSLLLPCSFLLSLHGKISAPNWRIPMAAKKPKGSRKVVKSLPSKRLSSKHARSVKGGSPLRVNWKVSG
jgi:hypothetical protein